MKDWIGNATAVFATHGASNHSDEERAELDYYATDPSAVQKIIDLVEFSPKCLEPCCGGGHISEVLFENGYDVLPLDIVNRGYEKQAGTVDFLSYWPEQLNERDIVTNPPYNKAMEFVEHSLEISQIGVTVAMFLKLTFLEGAKRKRLFDEHPPKYIYVFRNRIDCWKNGVKPAIGMKAVCYAWFVWENGWTGAPSIMWID